MREGVAREGVEGVVRETIFGGMNRWKSENDTRCKSYPHDEAM